MKTQMKIFFMTLGGMIGSAIILFNGVFAQDSSSMMKLCLTGMSAMLISVTAGLAAIKCTNDNQSDADWEAVANKIQGVLK